MAFPSFADLKAAIVNWGLSKQPISEEINLNWRKATNPAEFYLTTDCCDLAGAEFKTWQFSERAKTEIDTGTITIWR